MEKIITTFRYQIHNGKSWETSDYPGYSSVNECWRAAYNRAEELRKSGLKRIQVMYLVEERVVKEGQA